MPRRHPARALALRSAAGLIFISWSSLFLLSKGRSLYTKHSISLGSSFVLVCLFNLVSRDHSLFIVEKARAKWASALGAQSGGVHRAHLAALAHLKQALLPPQMSLSFIW